uniref:Uncharacterized protein n=1 Tax=Utricularia reniformis TaxID=192314 RepID=A0A1Y0AZP4_9LAMI|nr:hypothetical protein AEK19_MT0328 [Utricularia reniformis]ART30601.1 hypothetical protein AEK19_MT0328 [Utricularia reniformis]
MVLPFILIPDYQHQTGSRDLIGTPVYFCCRGKLLIDRGTERTLTKITTGTATGHLLTRDFFSLLFSGVNLMPNLFRTLYNSPLTRCLFALLE